MTVSIMKIKMNNLHINMVNFEGWRRGRYFKDFA